MGSTSLLLRLMPIWGLMMLTAMPWIRRRFWEWFLYLHKVVIVIFFVLFYYHSRYFINTAIIPLGLYVLDKLVRWISIYSRCCKVTTIHAYEDVVHLEITVNSLFSKWCQFPSLVGSVAYLNIPKAKFIEYHPISIAYNHGNVLGFFIKVVGNEHSWSHKLAKLSDKEGLRAYVEGPYTMVKRRADETTITEEKAKKLVNQMYHDNIMIVAGGCGFGGVSAYILDCLKAVKHLPSEEQAKKSMHVVLVVPHHAHFDAMKDILLECKECGFCKLHLYATYRNNEELRTNSPKGVDANSVRVKSLKGDVNEFVTLDYTVGRPDLKSILDGLDDLPITAFACGPKTLISSFYKELRKQKRRFQCHIDVFDM